jgi:uncharacterized alpha-E superfamily protein
VLLSRSAENLYWFGRYLERAGDTARVVREHTNLIVDLPTIVPITWVPLLAIVGLERTPQGHTDEAAVVAYLVAERANHGSIVSSASRARENLRTVRELVPAELWQVVNDLYLFVAGNKEEGVARAPRRRFLDRIVTECQRAEGIIASTMSRTIEHAFIRLGTLIERADMTTRVIDVSAATIGAQGVQALHGDVQWSSVLRSVAGLQMFRRAHKAVVSGAAVTRFLLGDSAFPRSFVFCIREAGALAQMLPSSTRLVEDCARLTEEARVIAARLHDSDDLVGVRHSIDSLQRRVAELDLDLSSRYFHHGATPE